MHSMKKIYCKEYNTAKGVSIATEFDKFKDILFNEKIIRHRMNRIQSKKHKLGTYEIDKISFSCLDDVCQMMEFVRLRIFMKIASRVVKRFKKVVIKKIVIKKMVIMEKG